MMKLIVLTTSDRTDHPGWEKLENSLKHFGYEYYHIRHPFAFGFQLPVIYNWIMHYQGDATHFLYTDAFDTIAMASPAEVVNKFEVMYPGIRMLVSGEKACFPHADRAKDYPAAPTPWQYVNGGGWIVEIEFFKQLMKDTDRLNDQVLLMELFFKNQDDIKIDYLCMIFQSIAFSEPKTEWRWERGRFINAVTDYRPIFFHGNGRTAMDWVYVAAERQQAAQ